MKRLLASAVCPPLAKITFLCLVGLSYTSIAWAQGSTIKQLFAFPCDVNNVCPSGRDPNSLIQSANGNFYGTTEFGGTGNKAAGTVFELSTSGVLTTLYTFVADQSGNYPQGSNPTSVVEGNDGFLYGTAGEGGSQNEGVVFKLSKTGTIQVLHNFCQACGGDGNQPFSLVLANNGDFYGCTTYSFPGTLFGITPTGAYKLLHTFSIGVDGAQCVGMIAASDGNIYGTTVGGFSFPTILFRLTPPVGLATVHSWRYPQFPASPPTQTSDTNIWGVTTGTLMFAVDLSGANYQQTALPYPFPPNVSFLTQASDGNFWGALGQDIVHFTGGGESLQQVPVSAPGDTGPALILQASNGELVGITNADGFNQGDPGEVFAVEPALAAPEPLFVSFNPASGAAGTAVMIHGTHLIGTTAVSFNGVSARFRVLNAGNIRAIVPVGATTGAITVVNKGGTATSGGLFTIP